MLKQNRGIQPRCITCEQVPWLKYLIRHSTTGAGSDLRTIKITRQIHTYQESETKRAQWKAIDSVQIPQKCLRIRYFSLDLSSHQWRDEWHCGRQQKSSADAVGLVSAPRQTSSRM